MKKLLITRKMPDQVVANARALFAVEERTSDLPMGQGECVTALQTNDAILPTLGDAFAAQVFDQPGETRCQILANFGVGYNHIDAQAASRAGVLVSNTPGAVTEATADIATMLILMAARRASEGEAMLRRGNWHGWQPTQLLGLHIGGKTLGIIGMGRIGKAIAQRCHAGFGMNVVFHNRSAVQDAGADAHQLKDAASVARAADVVVVALPGGTQTHHLIGADFFEQMQPHAVFINIARGDIVDESALISALENKAIAGAGLDVYENEPAVPKALIALDNVTLLPHLGTAALEVRESMGLMALDNLIAWNKGETPPNLVTP